MCCWGEVEVALDRRAEAAQRRWCSPKRLQPLQAEHALLTGWKESLTSSNQSFCGASTGQGQGTLWGTADWIALSHQALELPAGTECSQAASSSIHPMVLTFQADFSKIPKCLSWTQIKTSLMNNMERIKLFGVCRAVEEESWGLLHLFSSLVTPPLAWPTVAYAVLIGTLQHAKPQPQAGINTPSAGSRSFYPAVSAGKW